MDEMNPLENKLESWKPRPPSPEIARRLFGAASKPFVRPARRVGTWNWLSPVAACALTMLVAVHAPSRLPGRLAQRSNDMILASLMLNAAASNMASYSANQRGENVEYNFWSHATHHVAALPHASAPLLMEREVLKLPGTNGQLTPTY